MQVVSLLPHPDTTVARGTRFGGGLCVAYDFKEQLLACELVASSPRVCLGACVFSTMWMRKSVETVMCRCASISTTMVATRAHRRRALSRRE